MTSPYLVTVTADLGLGQVDEPVDWERVAEALLDGSDVATVFLSSVRPSVYRVDVPGSVSPEAAVQAALAPLGQLEAMLSLKPRVLSAVVEVHDASVPRTARAVLLEVPSAG